MEVLQNIYSQSVEKTKQIGTFVRDTFASLVDYEEEIDENVPETLMDYQKDELLAVERRKLLINLMRLAWESAMDDPVDTVMLLNPREQRRVTQEKLARAARLRSREEV